MENSSDVNQALKANRSQQPGKDKDHKSDGSWEVMERGIVYLRCVWENLFN